MTDPLISVIVPHYRQEWALPWALASIRAACDAHGSAEIIVVDDGSGPDIAAAVVVVCAGSGAKPIVLPENGGTAAAINAGTEIARGRYWTWASADNLMMPDWLTTLHAALEGRCDEAIYGRVAGYPPAKWHGSDGTVADGPVGAAYAAFTFERVGSREHAMAILTGHAPMSDRVLYAGPPGTWRQIDEEACRYGPAFLIDADVWRKAGGHEGRISHDLGHFLRVEEVIGEGGMLMAGVKRPLCRYLAHDQRATVVRRHEYDAPQILAAARERRGW